MSVLLRAVGRIDRDNSDMSVLLLSLLEAAHHFCGHLASVLGAFRE
jgi:hypothetical protein